MKELSEDGFETVDGKKIQLYEIKFNGSILLTPDEAASISTGDLVSFMVTARNGPPKFDQHKKKDDYKGCYKRINTFKLEGLVALDPDRAKQVYDTLGEHVEGVNEGLVETSFVLPEEEQELGFDPQEAML